MCGIAGFAGVKDRALLEKMTRSLRHRGPDGAGYFEDGGASLGSQRLAIIDLAAGPQPLTSEDGGVVVVFNGEIYNFRELRRELEGRGHRFKTGTDTEVVAHLYEEHGPAALERLSGMFAVALWDARRRTLLLARDPMGVKPLYYAERGGKLYFGSEVKALLAVPELSRELDFQSLGQYLDFLYVAAPRTIYRDIRKLRPGECLLWRGGEVSRRLFWEPRVGGAELGRAEALERLDGLLGQVVSDQFVADVPVGLFLSGGLDSTTLAYQLSRQKRSPEAFCAYFSSGGEDFNEVHKARVVAKHFGLRLTELCIEPNVEEVLDTLIDAFDEPLADSSSLPTYWLSHLARQRVTVALTGIGGDEVFGGYARYLGAKLLPAYHAVPRSARGLIRAGARYFPGQLSSRNVTGWARRFLAADSGLPEKVYSGWLGHLDDRDRRALLTPVLRAALPSRSHVLEAFDGFKGDFLKRVQAVDLRTYLPDDLLAHADRMSMKVGLELRVPLCDLRLVEFALSLPPEFHVSGFRLKPMLKELLKDRVPLEIVAQPKQGFMIPLGPWFRDELKPLAEWGVAGLKRRGLLRQSGMDMIMREHLAGWRNRTDVIWSWILLERWLERYAPDFRGDSPPPRPPRREKVLMVSDEIFPDSGGGGLGRGAWQESLALKERGHDVRLWCLDRKGGRPGDEVIDGLRVYRLDASRSYRHPLLFPLVALESRRNLARVLADFKPDVVIGQSPLSTWLIQSRPELETSRFVYRYNSSWAEEYSIDRPGVASWPGRLMRRWIERAVIARQDCVAAISDWMNANFVGHYRLPATTLPAGIDFDDFAPGDKAEARRALGLDGAPLLVTVRNLRPRMGWDVLFGAAELLRGELPGLRIEIVGTGPMAAELQHELERRGLSGCVRLAGRVSDERLRLYYRAADLFVLPTTKLEGLGLVLLEALSAGTPCVGTPIGGIPEVLRPIDPGWVADAAEPAAFAAAIRRGLANRLSPDELRAKARERYGWDRMAKGLDGLFTERPRLLHLVTRLDFGGSAENVLLACEGARQEGFDAAVASGPSKAPTILASGVPVLPVPSLRRELSPWRDLKAFFEIIRLLRSWRPDILHTHSSKAGVLGRWAARLLRLFGEGPRLVVHTPHGHVFYGYFGRAKTRLFEAVERRSAGAADALVALSEGEKREHLALGIGTAEQWSVVPSGVEVAERPAPPLPADHSVVLGCVARLDPVKGVGVLVEAAARAFARAKTPARLLLVGDGEQRASLERLAERLGVADRVTFAGYQADPASLMKTMHVYAQPSLNEGMGKTLVQAQALGLPVAASRVCGIPDVVADGVSGLLVPPGDPDALADALVALIDDPALRRRLGESGARRMRELDETGHRAFSVESMVARLNGLYRRALLGLALACAFCAPPRARAETLRVALHLHSDVSHGGKIPLETIADAVERAGIDVLIPTDTLVARWEYGLWPLRGLVKKRVAEPSVLAYGPKPYLERLARLRAAHPKLVVIPGVEAAAYYRWSGTPWGGLTIHDWNRHLLVFGPEDAAFYARLPVMGNSAGVPFDAFLLWPLVLLLIGGAGWAATRRRRFAVLALAGFVFLADGWPFRRLPESAYAASTPWTPYQRLIDAARGGGALAVWAHPSAPNWPGASVSGRVSVRTDPYPDALVRTTDYDGFAALKEGLRATAEPGGTWDKALRLYVDGERARAPWAFAELDFREESQTKLDAAEMIVDAASRRPVDVLASLAAGKFYSLQVATLPFGLKRYALSGAGASAAAGETLWHVHEPRLDVELDAPGGPAREAELEVIRDGEVVVKETVRIPGLYSYPMINSAARSYYRIVARDGNDVLVANPIFSYER